MYFACARDNSLFLVHDINANVGTGYIDLSDKPIELELVGEVFSKTVPDVLGIGWFCPWHLRAVVETVLNQVIKNVENSIELFNSLGSLDEVKLIVISRRWILTKGDVGYNMHERLHRSYATGYDADPIFLRAFKSNPLRSVPAIRDSLVDLGLLSTNVVFREHELPPMGPEER